MKIQQPLRPRSAFGDWLHEAKISARYHLDGMTGYPRLLKQAERRLGYRPDHRNPKTFNEKILWRKLHDRNPLFPIVSDKVRLHDYLRDILGADRAQAILPDLLLVTDDPDSIDFATLPADYVIKSNHASGWNIFVRADDPVDEARARQECKRWLRLSYGKLKREDAYLHIPRRIMIEGWMEGPGGRPADDFKMNMIGGKLAFGMWADDRFGDFTQHYVDGDFRRLAFRTKDVALRDLPPKPRLFDEMLAVAEELGRQFDSVRVDFMFTEDRFVLNELTLYKDSGMDPFRPERYDREFGDLWHLPNLDDQIR